MNLKTDSFSKFGITVIEMISFVNVFKTVAYKFAIRCKKISVHGFGPLVTRTFG